MKSIWVWLFMFTVAWCSSLVSLLVFPSCIFPTHPRHMLVRELGPLFLLTSLSSDSYCVRTAWAELDVEFWLDCFYSNQEGLLTWSGVLTLKALGTGRGPLTISTVEVLVKLSQWLSDFCCWKKKSVSHVSRMYMMLLSSLTVWKVCGFKQPKDSTEVRDLLSTFCLSHCVTTGMFYPLV